MIDQTISHYKILEKLGEGGMGVVYKAQDTTLDRLVALKFLPQHLSASEQDKARFIQEAKAAAALNHPNICTIHGIEDHDGQTFIVMEFVEGRTLRDKSEGATSLVALPLKQGIEIGIQLADGLAAAHEKGIFHRDLKPENIMLQKDGRVKIMDFGLAKLKGASRLTKAGSTVGTTGYMSPEQVQGMESDHRSDIFSLGVILYELFSGQSPFKGVHEAAINYEIVNVDPEPMSAVKHDIDPRLDAIVLECLAKEVHERTQSVAEVGKDLRHFKRESSRTRHSRTISVASESGKPVEGGRPFKFDQSGTGIRRYGWPVVSLLLAIALTVSLWALWQARVPTPRPPSRFSIELPVNLSLVASTSSIALSGDGRNLVYSSAGVGGLQLFLRKMENLAVQPITGSNNAVNPSFSPDGQWIAFESNLGIMKVSIAGGAQEQICAINGQTRGLWWGADDMIYFGQISDGIFRVPASGGTPELVSTLDVEAGEISHRFPQLLPDGKTLIFTVKPNNITSFDEAPIVAERIGSKERKVLIRGGTFGRYIPSGHLVYARGSSILAVPFDANRLAVLGPPVQVEQGGWLNRASGDAQFSISNNGTLVFAPADPISFEAVTLAWFDRSGKSTPLLDSARAFSGCDVSPDGQKLALLIQAANDDIWLYHLARKTLTRFTFGGGNHGWPRWSADGQFVFYTREIGRATDVFRKKWDGSGSEERLTHGLNVVELGKVDRAGRLIPFVQNGDIWVLPLEQDRKPRPIIQTSALEVNPRISPDGRWIAYVTNESGRPEVYVTSPGSREQQMDRPVHSGKWQISSAGGFLPFWSSDGKQLFYQSGSSWYAVNIETKRSFDFSTPVKMFTVPESTLIVDLAPDDRRFVAGVFRTQALGVSHVTVVLEWFEELKAKFSSIKN